MIANETTFHYRPNSLRHTVDIFFYQKHVHIHMDVHLHKADFYKTPLLYYLTTSLLNIWLFQDHLNIYA